MSLKASKISWLNLVILILLVGAGIAALFNLYLNFEKQVEKDRAAYLDQNLQQAVLEFEGKMDQFTLLVSSIRSFNYTTPEALDGPTNHLFLKRLLQYSDYSNPIISSFLDTGHVFIYSVSDTRESPNDLVGTRLENLRDSIVLLDMDMVMQSDDLFATAPLNLYEGFVGLPINFGLRKEGIPLGYVATLIDIKNFIQPILDKDVSNEFTYQFIYGNSLYFDREQVYDNTEVFHDRRDEQNLKLHPDDYVWKRIDAFQSIFHVGIAYRNDEAINALLPFIQRSAILIGALMILLGLMIYLFLQQIYNTKIINEAKETAENMNQVLRKFISAVSYDLKKPLDNINKQINEFNTETNSQINDDSTKRIKIIDENSKHLNLLMDGFLSYAEVIKQENFTEKIDLNLIIQEIQKFYAEDNVKILSEPLPSTVGNKAQLDNLFRHLISNSIKFNNRECPRVVISSEFDDDRIAIRVSDDGIGIKQENLQAVFDDFKQLDGDHYDGVGLGLPICKEIVKNHGGKISAEINILGGTDIVFDLENSESDFA